MTIVHYNGTMFIGTREAMVDLVCDLTLIDPHASITYESLTVPAHA